VLTHGSSLPHFFANLKHWHLRNGGARIMSIEKYVHHQREKKREKVAKGQREIA
jgi:hypothetical protein